MVRPVPILMYHSIDTQCAPDYRRWMVRPEEFDGHLRALREAGYRAITVSELVAYRVSGTALPDPVVVITFDDGLHDFLTGAMPVLSRHGFPATLFVVSGQVGNAAEWLAPLGEGQRKMLGWKELRDLAAAGIEIGAHTISHPELDVLPVDKSLKEIADSKRRIEEGTGLALQSFAYPHGYASQITRDLVKGAGFRSACRVRHAISSTDENLYALSRVIMTSEIMAQDLPEFLSRPALPMAPPVDRLLSEGWRAVRRIRYAARGWNRTLQSGFLSS